MSGEETAGGPRHEDEDFVTGTHYAKVYASILDSSVWGEPPPTRCVWLALLVMCDREGFVEAANSGIYRRANVSPAEGREALKTLESPDLESKSQEWGGRRIEKVDRGWKILNYERYRDAQTPAQKAAADRQARFRDRRAAEAEWLQLNPGQQLPPDFHQQREALRNGDKTATVAVAVASSSSSVGATADVENFVETWETPTERRVAEALASDLDRQAFRSVLEGAPNRKAWGAECGARLDGMHPPILTGAQLGEALRDYVGNGSLKSASFKHFRAYLSRPDRPKEGGTEGGGANGTLPTGGSSPTGEAGAILTRLKGGSVKGETAEVKRAVEALGGLAAIRECKPDRWGFLVKDFVAHLAFARANPPAVAPPAPEPTPAPPPPAEDRPAMKAAQEEVEAWQRNNPGQPLPAELTDWRAMLKRPPKEGGKDTPKR